MKAKVSRGRIHSTLRYGKGFGIGRTFGDTYSSGGAGNGFGESFGSCVGKGRGRGVSSIGTGINPEYHTVIWYERGRYA